MTLDKILEFLQNPVVAGILAIIVPILLAKIDPTNKISKILKAIADTTETKPTKKKS